MTTARRIQDSMTPDWGEKQRVSRLYVGLDHDFHPTLIHSLRIEVPT